MVGSRLHILTAALCAALSGCTGEKHVGTYTVSASWPADANDEAVSFRLVRKSEPGVTLHEWTARDRDKYRYDAPRTTAAAELDVHVKTPEGWSACGAKLMPGSNRDAALFAVQGTSTYLWVDNQKGSATEVACGEFRFPVAADAKVRLFFPAPNRGPVPVRVGDAVVGEVRPHAPSDSFSPQAAYLIDAVGGRTYTLRTIVYQRRAPDFEFPGGAGGSERTLSGNRLYPIGASIDHFLEKAPNTVSAQVSVREQVDALKLNDGVTRSRVELTRE